MPLGHSTDHAPGGSTPKSEHGGDVECADARGNPCGGACVQSPVLFPDRGEHVHTGIPGGYSNGWKGLWPFWNVLMRAESPAVERSPVLFADCREGMLTLAFLVACMCKSALPAPPGQTSSPAGVAASDAYFVNLCPSIHLHFSHVRVRDGRVQLLHNPDVGMIARRALTKHQKQQLQQQQADSSRGAKTLEEQQQFVIALTQVCCLYAATTALAAGLVYVCLMLACLSLVLRAALAC
eukprot:1145299-Pelagomonas_calceolata.AAC.1